MLPLKLSLQGINSYQNLQVIDFQNLVANKTFGIFGSVGSGKSTIPEAISFVLYGKMERLNKSDGLSYNVMNLKSNTLLIDFEFEAENSEKFRFVVNGKRNSKNFEDVNLERSRYRWENDEWLPDENLEAEKILGLSYDNFKRTIIIPQNKFMEFIQLGDADRTRMLKEIFNLEKYDLLSKVKILENLTEKSISNLQGNLEGLKEINQNTIDEKIKENENAKTKKNESEAILNSLNIEFQKQNDVKILFEELKNAVEKFYIFDLEKPQIELVEKDLKTYKICLLNFKSAIDEKNRVTSKIGSFKKENSGLKISYFALLEKIKKQKSSLDLLKIDYNNIDKLKSENEELGKIAMISEINTKISELESKLKEINLTSKHIEIKITEIENQIDESKNQIKKKEVNAPDLTLLSQIKEWHFQKEHIQKNLDEIQDQIKIKNKKLLEYYSFKTSLIHSSELKDFKISEEENVSSIIELLESKTKSFAEGLRQLMSEKENLTVKLKLREFSHSLVEGKPCPVCGALSHPQPLKSENIGEEIDKLQSRIKKGEEMIKSINSKIEIFKNLNSDINNESKNIDDLLIASEEKKVILKQHLSQFIWTNFSPDNKESVISVFDSSNSLINEIKILREKLETLSKIKEIKGKERETMQKTIFSLKNEIQGLTSRKETLLSQIKILSYRDYEEIPVSQILETQKKSIDRVSRLIAEYTKEESELKANELSETELKTKISGAEKTLEQLEQEFLILNDNIRSDLTKFGFKTEGEINSILDKNIDIAHTELRINDFKLAYEIQKKEKENLERKVDGKKFDTAVFEVLKEKILETKSEISKFQHYIGGLQKVIEDWTSKLIQKTALSKQLEVQELRLEDLKTMRSLFISNGFVNYISTVRLRELVNYANSRFHMLTRGRLSLELNQTNSFSIIDFLNEGKKRSVKTLSGGQQFQVSLSLALALAAVVQKQNKTKQNFFFLDEGFGTQDEESLNLVFDTISSLRKENRVVGLISHVAELKEGINAYLEVINEENSGSLIVRSWEKE